MEVLRSESTKLQPASLIWHNATALAIVSSVYHSAHDLTTQSPVYPEMRVQSLLEQWAIDVTAQRIVLYRLGEQAVSSMASLNGDSFFGMQQLQVW